MKKSTLLFAIVSIVLFSCGSSKPATALSEDQVAQVVKEQTYQFNVEYVQPLGGKQRTMSPGYKLLVTGDQVIADLPYFGKAYSANIGSTDGGIKFTSKDFSYSSEAGNKSSTEIQIKPKDVQDIQELFLTIYSNGSANLRVNSNNRQSISYTGDVTKPR